jgi:hypothetical protein
MEWKKYQFLNRVFEVSASGKVRNEHGKILKGSLQPGGFRSINLKFYNNGEHFTKNFIIHRMVAQCWIDNWDLKPYVIHLNGNIQDNRAKNLAWVTPEEKIAHQQKMGKQSPKYKLTTLEVVQIKKMLIEKKTSIVDIAHKFGVSHTQIHRIKRGENWANIIVLLQLSKTP